MNEDPSLQPPAQIFLGNSEPHHRIAELTDVPPWRRFAHLSPASPEGGVPGLVRQRGKGYYARPEEIRAVNLALYLRRPLLVTGDPGTGKSTLAYAVAYELGLSEVFVWPITSRSSLSQGLYQYDAIGRLQEAALKREEGAEIGGLADPADIGRFIRLGPLGTALRLSEPGRLRVLLIDEIDKSDIDLPSDLLHVFEEGEFEIPELSRLPQDSKPVPVTLAQIEGKKDVEGGRVRCAAFPLVILTSNGERDFSPAFLRRCIRLDIKVPKGDELLKIIAQRIGTTDVPDEKIRELARLFEADRDDPARVLATDQLLNAVYLLTKDMVTLDIKKLRQDVFRPLSNLPSEAGDNAGLSRFP